MTKVRCNRNHAKPLGMCNVVCPTCKRISQVPKWFYLKRGTFVACVCGNKYPIKQVKPIPTKKNKVCECVYKRIDKSIFDIMKWQTGCGIKGSFVCKLGDLKYIYCPYCGLKIKLLKEK